MTLRKRTLLIIGSALIGLLGLLFIVSSTILLKGFIQLERKIVEKDMNRLLSVLTEEFEKLSVEAGDYAVWDDTYQYMEDFNASFIGSNFSENTFATLNLDFILLIDLEGRITFGKTYNRSQNKLEPISADFVNHLKTSQLFTSSETNQKKLSGFLLLPHHITMIALSPILTSHTQGPSRGTLVMGRILTESLIHRLSELTQLTVNFYRLDQSPLPAHLIKVYEKFSATGESLIIRVLGKNSIAGYSLIEDIYHKQVLLAQITIPRDIYRQGLTNIHYLNGAVLASALIFTCLVLWLFEKLVLARLASLSDEVLHIRTTDVSSTVTVEGNDELAYLAVTINHMIAALRASYHQVQRSEASLAEAQRIAHLGNWTLDVATQDFHWSAETYRIFGLESKSGPLNYNDFLKQVCADDQELVKTTFEDTINYSKPCSIELTILCQETEKRILHLQGEVVQNMQGRVVKVIGTFQDITELKQAQAETERLLEENRFLIHRSIAIQEAERRNLARELHDEFGQCITAIQADAEAIAELVESRETLDYHSQDKIKVGTNAILAISTHMYDVVHSLMRQLRPSSLDELGLVEALQETVTIWQARYPKTQCTFIATGNFHHLEETINITLYRVVQECLTNIAKYAQATEVTIDLRIDERSKRLILCVQDNGKGMDIAHHKRGLGLIGMRERAHALAGGLILESSLGTGVKITLAIPVAEEYQQKYRPWKRR